MNKLLKADFWKLSKDKLLIIGLLVCCGLSIFTVLIYGLMNSVFTSTEQGVMEAFGNPFSGRAVFLNSFSPTNNAGILIPIFISIVVVKDFTYGTIRNKIINGKSRLAIFFSTYISTLVVGLIIYLSSILVSLLFGSLILGYGETFTLSELGFILGSIGYGVAFFAVYLSFAIFIGMTTQKVGLSIILNLAFLFLFTILSSMATINLPSVPQVLLDIFAFNPNYSFNLLIADNILNGKTKEIIMAISSTIVFLVVLIGGGALLFKNSDLK